MCVSVCSAERGACSEQPSGQLRAHSAALVCLCLFDRSEVSLDSSSFATEYVALQAYFLTQLSRISLLIKFIRRILFISLLLLYIYYENRTQGTLKTF